MKRLYSICLFFVVMTSFAQDSAIDSSLVKQWSLIAIELNDEKKKIYAPNFALGFWMLKFEADGNCRRRRGDCLEYEATYKQSKEQLTISGEKYYGGDSSYEYALCNAVPLHDWGLLWEEHWQSSFNYYINEQEELVLKKDEITFYFISKSGDFWENLRVLWQNLSADTSKKHLPPTLKSYFVFEDGHKWKLKSTTTDEHFSFKQKRPWLMEEHAPPYFQYDYQAATHQEFVRRKLGNWSLNLFFRENGSKVYVTLFTKDRNLSYFSPPGFVAVFDSDTITNPAYTILLHEEFKVIPKLDKQLPIERFPLYEVNGLQYANVIKCAVPYPDGHEYIVQYEKYCRPNSTKNYAGMPSAFYFAPDIGIIKMEYRDGTVYELDTTWDK